jgi:hypothetical protein
MTATCHFAEWLPRFYGALLLYKDTNELFNFEVWQRLQQNQRRREQNSMNQK